MTTHAITQGSLLLLKTQVMAEVQAGARPLPENTQALIEALPPMVWPE